MIPNQEVRDKVRYEFDSRWMFGPTDFAFTAMEAGYNHGDEWMDAVCEYLRGNVELVNAFVAEKMPKVHVTRHEGTFLMWLDMTCAGKPSGEITSILVKAYGLALGDGSHYGKRADGFMRQPLRQAGRRLHAAEHRLHPLCTAAGPGGSGALLPRLRQISSETGLF